MKARLFGRIAAWVVAVALIAGLVLFSAYRARKLAKERSPDVERRPRQAVRVATIRVGPITEWVFGQGTARAVRRGYLYFRSSGVVTWVKSGPGGGELREGDRVKKGEFLAQIDPRDCEQEIKVQKAMLAAARARLSKARSDLAAQEKLLKQNVVAPEERRRAVVTAAGAEADMLTSRARLEQANVALERTKLIAPQDGIMAYKNCRKGYFFDQQMMNVQSEAQLLKNMPMVIIDPSEYEVTVEVPAFQAVGVRPGATARFGLNNDLAALALKAELGEGEGTITTILKVKGKVFSVNPVVDPSRRSVQVRIRTRQQAKGLQDGSFVVCWIDTATRMKTTIMPFGALLYRDGRPYCFVVEEGDPPRARLRWLRLGLEGRTNVEVLKGVNPGEKLVVEGQHVLVDGAPVAVVEAEEPAVAGAK